MNALPRLRPTLPSLFTKPQTHHRRTYARLSLIGRLAAPPEQSLSSTGRTLIRYAVGTSHGPADRRETSWFKISHFCRDNTGALEDLLLGLGKGTLVHVEADSKLRTYDDVNGGGKRINLDLVQRSVEVLSRPRVEGGPEQEAQGEVEQGEAAASG